MEHPISKLRTEEFLTGIAGGKMRIEVEREEDGRWIADLPDIPGVMTCGHTREQAVAKTEALALRVIADRLDHGEAIPRTHGNGTRKKNDPQMNPAQPSRNATEFNQRMKKSNE